MTGSPYASAEIIGRKDEDDETGQIYQEYEQTILANRIALEIGHYETFNQDWQDEGDGEPDHRRSLKKDEQYPNKNAGKQIHDERDENTGAEGVPLEQGEGDAFDQGDEQINNK